MGRDSSLALVLNNTVNNRLSKGFVNEKVAIKAFQTVDETGGFEHHISGLGTTRLLDV